MRSACIAIVFKPLEDLNFGNIKQKDELTTTDKHIWYIHLGVVLNIVKFNNTLLCTHELLYYTYFADCFLYSNFLII